MKDYEQRRDRCARLGHAWWPQWNGLICQDCGARKERGDGDS